MGPYAATLLQSLNKGYVGAAALGESTPKTYSRYAKLGADLVVELLFVLKDNDIKSVRA